MNINFDRVADAIYFSMKKGKVASTRELDDRLIVDLDKSGNIIGFELLDASTQLGKRGGNLEQVVSNGIPIQLTSSTPISA